MQNRSEGADGAVEAISALELYGMISSHFIHALTNHMTCVVGNLHVARNPRADAKTVEAALESVSNACNEAGRVIGRFREMRIRYTGRETALDIATLMGMLAEEVECHSGWMLHSAASSSQKLLVDKRWIRLLMRVFILECSSNQGCVEVGVDERETAPVMATSQKFLRMTIRARGPFSDLSGQTPETAMERLAASEYVRSINGWVERCSPSAQERQIIVLLPFQS